MLKPEITFKPVTGLISRLILPVFILTLFAFGQDAAAEIYKWVDADGNVQYTQHPPPPGIEGESIKPPPKISSDKAVKQLESQLQREQKQQERRNKAADKRREAEQERAEYARACEQARQRLNQAQRPRVRTANPDGSRTRLSEEDRQKIINQANKDIEEYCK